jgi:hypothetical protein
MKTMTSKLYRCVNWCTKADAPSETHHTWVGTGTPSLHLHSLGITGKLSKLRQVLYFSSHGHIYDISHQQQFFNTWAKSNDDESILLSALVTKGCYIGAIVQGRDI